MNKKYLLKLAQYAAGSFFNKVLHFLFIPIFTAFFVPEEYAVYSNILIFIAFASLVYSLGLQQSIFSYFYDKHDRSYQFTFINTVFITIFVFGLFFTLSIFLFKNQVSHVLLRTTEYHKLFWFVGAIIFFDTLYTMTLSFLNILEKSSNFALLSSVKTVLLLIFFIFLAVTKEFSLNAVFFVTFLSAFISAIIALIHMKNILIVFSSGLDNIIRFSPRIMKEALSFGVVMIPGTIAMLVLRLADRYMLTYLVSTDATVALHSVGIYALGYRVGMIMHFLVSLISLVYFPYAMKISKQPWAKQSYRRMFHWYLIFGSLFAALIILFANHLFDLFVDEAFYPALQIVGYGVISSFLTGIFNLLNIGFYIKKKAKSIAITVILGAMLNIFLNFFMIKKWGINGAGIASVIAYVFIVLFQFWNVERLYHIGYRLILILIFIFSLCFLMSMNNVYYTNSFYIIIVKCIILVASIVTGYVFYRKNKGVVRNIHD